MKKRFFAHCERLDSFTGPAHVLLVNPEGLVSYL